MEAARIIQQGWRADPGCCEGAGLGQGVADCLEEGAGEGDGDARFFRCVINRGPGDGHSCFREEHGIGCKLEAVVIFGDAVIVFITAGGTFFVVDDFPAGGGVFDQVDDAAQAEGLGLEGQGAQRGTL